MTLQSLNLVAALPEIWLLSVACVILLLDLFIRDEQRDLTYFLSLVALAGTAALSLNGLDFIEKPVFAFSGMFVLDAMGSVLKIGMCLTMAVVFVYGRAYANARGFYQGELFTLSLFALLGMMVMASATNMLTLYVGLELLSLSIYALVALPRDNKVATESAMKYFVLGALASGMLLYGMSMVYGATASLDIHRIAEVTSSGQANRILMIFGLVFIVTGIGFKLGNVPFHMWVPDVYQGSPTTVTMLIASAPKLAAFAFVVRLLIQAMPTYHQEWQGMLIVLAVASLLVGNLLAIAQTNLKRMLAYSTISHMGFLLLGVLAGTQAGISASMFYALVYSMMSVAAFGMILLLSRHGFEAEELSDLKGLAKRSPWFAWMMLLVMFSMAGIPVFIGFFAKLAVIQSVVEVASGDLIWLAVLAVMASLLGTFYYLRVVKLMFMDQPVDMNLIAPKADLKVLLSLNALLLLALGLAPQAIVDLCQRAISSSLVL